MLQIKTTPNLYGITLSGDYQDLNELYDSISRYLSFYMSKMGEGYPYHEYEYLLSLNYDIRHAYMGARGIEVMENNAENVGTYAECIYELPETIKKEHRDIRRSHKKGNLYFTVNILYPMVFHYLIAFENILLDEPFEELFENLTDDNEPWMENYTFFDALCDQAQIRQFTSLIWKNIQKLLGKESILNIYDYYMEADFMVPLSLYCDVLLHCQMRNFPCLTKEEKLHFLELSLYEIIDSDDLVTNSSDYENSYNRYKACITSLQKKHEFPVFPKKRVFYDKLEEAFPPKAPMYEDDFDNFLEKTYGVSGDEEPEW